jgi:hypothetical protein
MRGMKGKEPGRRISRLGLVLILAIALAVIAFGLFKRKGARKPPPIPQDATGLNPTPAGTLPGVPPLGVEA